MKTINKILKSKKGFTLIELVVVIAVLGMIAVVAVPKIAGITAKAKTASDGQTIAVLNEAVERYIAESGKDIPADNDTAEEVITFLSTQQESKYGPYIKKGNYTYDKDGNVELPSKEEKAAFSDGEFAKKK
ncbi:hypothetical protein EAL2_c16380 [Peptoclostridium acidaminophilum DSM 3953]|uniref:Prepilin-type N-terminal cleavage/methylation domain-containing protein n=1 Tax=Peptoclostridium acidaminophilum DSM 3953 TaxID=1286171 RepID=W8TGH3_PEPAC|nr:type II secretion system protein [Peptoclostridium acidaminophilum]AHM56933.1 hypothetical protein EAL2_c16380 [Peptoclostridium acidaminophilum DSM 3953]